MQYRTDPKSGNELSILGFGCMRFPRTRGPIDEHKSEQLIMDAIEKGVNYFDTAYIYGGSEDVLGRILHKNDVRDKVFIATKLPLMKCQSPGDFDRLFSQQLERLHTDHIDYYLMHNLTDTVLWKRLCDLGIEAWIAEKKRTGAIRQAGFSFHGSQTEFFALLDAYDWDFCQIQYNYVNTHYQAGTAGLHKATEKGLPVFIMEPLLGGKLASGLPAKAANLFREMDAKLSPAAWALRWLWNQKEVTLVLSGMNQDSQLAENIEIANASSPGMLTQGEAQGFDRVVEVFNETYKVHCTGCNYCMPCPNHVNIPACFAAYNMSYAVGKFAGLQQYMTSTGVTDPAKNFGASQCVGCGKCERQCPQHIPIIQSLESVRKRMEPFWLKPAISLFMKFLK